MFYGPLWATISNPLFDKTYQPIIWEDCALLRLEPDYHGIYDLVDYYGDMMALAAEAAGVNLLNSKLSFAFGAKNKAMAESMKKLYDSFASGEPAVFADAALLDDQGNLMVEMFNQNVGQNFIADRLLETMRSIKCMFLTDIGVPNTNLYKASGVNAAEVSANNIETRSKCELWLDELQEGCRKANEMFPDINLSVKWRDDIENIMKGGVIDERMGERGGDL